MEPRAHPKTYRLRGNAGGAERIFDLTAGEHRLGGSSASDIQLSLTGISRQHAVLLVTPGGLAVEDRGSTNGTFVNNIRVERAAVPGGSELRFGPVRFKVEVLEDQDAEIAIELGTEPATESTRSSLALGETTRIHGDEGVASPALWLPVIDGFLVRLSSPDQLAAALTFLAESLGLAGACVVEWSDQGRPVVLAACGAIHEVPAREEIRELHSAPEDGRGEGRVFAALYETEPALSLALRFGPRDLGLLLWGEFDGRPNSVALLRIILGLVERLHSSPSVFRETPRDNRSEPRGRHSELVFPDGYEMGTSPAMASFYQELVILTRGDLPVLIQGETGVGKDLVARILHGSSERRQGPLVAVNCAAIPAELLEAEMFGIGRGVATGVAERAGKFREAEGGTLFLDEISEMSPALQAKLLRALQEKEIHPVGGRARSIDVRILSATNTDLMKRIECGQFRDDLYYRLAGYTLEVPPLRGRQADIPGLVRHFLWSFSKEIGIHPRGITVKALHLLTLYPWPGNVRQLEHEIRRLVYKSADGQIIDSGLLSPAILSPAETTANVVAANAVAAAAASSNLALAPRVREFEIELIREALRRTAGHQGRAARLLGLSRNGLVKKMSRLGFRGEKKRPADILEPSR